MGNGFKPVGAALPPRRDGLARVNAADGAPSALPGGADSIIVPEARDRMLELIEREQLPTDVRSTLAGALTGDLRRQQLLFQAMIDTWPRLQKALAEVKRAARKAPWQVRAWAPRGEKPQAAAETLAREVENTIWVEWPETKDEKGLAERDEKLGLTTGRVPVARAWFYERHGIPLPAEGEELFLPAGQDSEALNPKHEARKEEGNEEANGQQSAVSREEGKELEAGGKKPVAAADAGGAVAPLSVEQLSGAVLEGLTGVSAEWLRPVRPFF